MAKKKAARTRRTAPKRQPNLRVATETTGTSPTADWQRRFQQDTVQVDFSVKRLTPRLRAFICAVADGVEWDRQAEFGGGVGAGGGTAAAAKLFRRGLIKAKCPDQAETDARAAAAAAVLAGEAEWGEFTNWELTPAGTHVVALLRLAGLFMEAELATVKRLRGRNGA